MTKHVNLSPEMESFIKTKVANEFCGRATDKQMPARKLPEFYALNASEPKAVARGMKVGR